MLNGVWLDTLSISVSTQNNGPRISQALLLVLSEDRGGACMAEGITGASRSTSMHDTLRAPSSGTMMSVRPSIRPSPAQRPRVVFKGSVKLQLQENHLRV